MRIFHVLAVAATLSLGLSIPALAEGSGTAHSQYKLTQAEAQGMAGTFRLDDGRLLVLTSKRSKLFAEFDGRREELVPVGANRFVSRDTGAELTFDQVPFGAEVVLNQARR